jgi:hypothetical protein
VNAQTQCGVVDIKIHNDGLKSSDALDNLTIKVNDKHHAKACCICDVFIMYGDERTINIDDLKHKNVMKVLAKSCIDLSKEDGVPKAAETNIKCYYTPHCLPANHNSMKLLKKLYLSPKSYLIMKSGRNRSKKIEFGCCKQCKKGIEAVKRSQASILKPPCFAIANGLMTGPVPKELACLNEVELATISLARVQHHVVSIHAGAHKQIKGWHSMYLNDVSGVMGTVNWCIANTENENEDDESVDSQTARAITNEREEAEYVGGSDDSDDDNDEEHVSQTLQCEKTKDIQS